MDHRTIDAENVAERYVTGRLSPEKAADFEEHYLDCPACCARVEAAERLERGLRRLAEEAAAGTPRVARPARWRLSPRWGLAAAAVLVVAVLPAGYGFREVQRLRGDLATTRAALAHAEAEKVSPDRLTSLEGELQKARRELAAEAEQRETLAREVAAGRQPQANLTLLPLTPVRGAPGGGPVRTLTLPKEPGWVALWVEPGEDYPAYRATLRNARGAIVFKTSGLALNDLGSLLLTVHSTTLAPGSYRLDLEGIPRTGAPVALSRFPLRVFSRG
jgi:hypothetical protein